MKSRSWLALLAGLLVLCIGLSVVFLGGGRRAGQVEIWSDGVLIRTMPLFADETVTVQTGYGYNIITVHGGAVAVTEANCPDGYCMQRGYCASGTPIVCLPHRLVLRFTVEAAVDGVVG